MRLFFAFLIGFLLIWKMWCEPKIVYKTTNIECTDVPKLTANASCRLKAISWNLAVAQMDVDFLQPVRNMSVHIKVFKRDYSNKYQPFLVDVVVNMCDIIGRRNYSPYGRYLWGLFKRYTNFNHSCPFVGHMFARGIFLDESVVPVKLPLGDYQIVLFPFENYREKPPQSIGSIKFNAQAMVPVIPKRNRTNPTDRTTSRAPQTVIVPVKNGK